jgi:BirA family biotin operon repressor/biotin-[acetyl-CoA-carboxylase] ligase
MSDQAPVNWQIEIYQSVESTQTLCHDAAQNNRPEGIVIQGLQQKGGKGRHGNRWDSPVGNLYMSILLRPDCAIEQAGQLSFVVAVAVSAAMDDYIDPHKHTKTLKWPNDILVDGMKLSGILLESNMSESKLRSIILGMGVNIFNKPPLATCLNDVARDPVYINVVRDNILKKLSYCYRLWQEKGFAPIHKEWLKQAHGMGQPMTARLPGKSFKGIFQGVREDGSLILAQENGEEKIIHAAEVHFGETG